MSRVLITGGNGFIGSHLIRGLVVNGITPVVLLRKDSNIERIKSTLSQCEVVCIENNLLETIEKVSPPDFIVHASTLYKKYDSLREIDEQVRANFLDSIALFEWAEQKSVKAFFFMSTFFTDAIEETDGYCKVSNKSFNIYAALKYAVESYISKRSFETKAYILKIFTPYGPFDNDKLIMKLIRSEISGGKFEISAPSQGLDLVYIDNLVDLIVKFIKRPIRGLDVEKIDVGCGKLTSVSEIRGIIKKIVQEKKTKSGLSATDYVEILPPRCNSPKAQVHEQWKDIKLVSTEEGLKRTIEWVFDSE